MRNLIKKVLKEEYGDINIQKSNERNLAHYASPLAFSLAKKLRKNPIIIAEELKNSFKKNDIFSKIEAVNGYLNFKLSLDFLNTYADNSIKKDFSFIKENKNEKILLEFVSANPTGPLHIGHLRGAIFGDILSRLGKALGYEFYCEYYINDKGRQIELLGLSIYLNAKEHILKENISYPEEYYKGEYILDLSKKAKEVFGNEIFKEKNISKLGLWGKDEMLLLIKDNLKEVNIEFDNFISESSLYHNLESTLKKLKENDGIYDKDGKTWIRSSKYSDEKDRVIIKEDKTPTYLTGDIMYHDNKFKRNFDKYINIWGADHHGYIKRIKASLEFLNNDSLKLEVLLSQMVSLLKNKEPYKMSKRAGNFILMSDVVKEMGADNLRFIFISKKSDTHLEFDIENLKKQDSSNPIYYINYAHARIFTMLKKSKFKKEIILETKLKNLDENCIDLLFDSLSIKEVLEDTFKTRQLQKIAEFLKSLASSYHKFYNEYKIIGNENEKELLKLSLIVALAIRTGLKILGINAKESM